MRVGELIYNLEKINPAAEVMIVSKGQDKNPLSGIEDIYIAGHDECCIFVVAESYCVKGNQATFPVAT